MQDFIDTRTELNAAPVEKHRETFSRGKPASSTLDVIKSSKHFLSHGRNWQKNIVAHPVYIIYISHL